MCASDSSDQCLLNNVQPSDPIAFFNATCKQGNVPSHYIEVRSPDQVSAAFDFARRYGIQLSIKNSGHDFLGRNSGKGTVGLWVRRLGGISRNEKFVPEGCTGVEPRDTITTAAGVNFDEVYQFAEEQNVTFIGGYAATVGATGGWVQGGGHSVLSTVYGLGIDRVLQYKVVTADGVLRTANTCTNSDLFWALRGGGGGTFGVVMAATHAVEPKMRLSVASIKYTQTALNVNGWLEILVNNSLRWANEGWGGHYLANNLIGVTPLLSLANAAHSMRTASDFAIANNGTVILEELPSWYDFYTKYVIPNTAPVGNSRILASRMIPASIFSTEAGRAKLMDLLQSILKIGFSPYIPNTTPFLYPWIPGSTSATTAWRGAVWHLSIGATWEWNSTVTQRRSVNSLLNTLMGEMEELVPGGGAYLNEANPWTKNWKWEWWGENYERLVEIKEKYDPDGLLSCWRCVGFNESGADMRFPCFNRLTPSV